MIELKDLSFSYGLEMVFEETNFVANKNQITILKGESGSGKTTLLDILSLKFGNYFHLEYNHQPLNEENNKDKYLENLYYMNQAPIFCLDLKLYEQWEALQSIYAPYPDLDDLLEMMGLNTVKNQYPSQLSQGEKLRAALVNILIIKPKIILMDEPTASLDFEYKQIFIEMLKSLKNNSHIIISTHDLNLISIGDKVYEINNHKLNVIKYLEEEINGDVLEHKKNDFVWFQTFLKMNRHHFIKKILSFILFSSAISFCAFTINIDNGFLTNFEKNLESMNNATVLLYKPLDIRKPGYNYDNTGSTYFPISNIEYEDIRQVDHIKKISPRIIISTYDDIFSKKEILPSLCILKDDKVIYDYATTIEEMEKEKKYFFTLFVEGLDSKDYVIEKFGDDKKGIYINEMLLSRFKLNKEDLKGCYMKIVLGIPTYDVSGNNSIAYPTEEGGTLNDDDFIPANSLLKEPKEVLLPINGIVSTGQDSSMLVDPTQALYMDRMELEALTKTNHSQESFQEYIKDIDGQNVEVTKTEEADFVRKYTSWRPNAYDIEIDQIQYVQEVVNVLKNKGYEIDWEYNNYKIYGESLKNTKNIIQFTSYSIMLFVVILFGIIHFVKGNEERDLNIWLKAIGYFQRIDLLKIKLQRYALNTLLICILSYLGVWFINIYSIYVYYTPYVINIKSLGVIIIISILSQLIIPMIWEVLHYDKN